MKKVLKFFTPDCGPSKMLTKMLSSITTTIPIEEIDIEQNNDLSTEYKVSQSPTLIVLEDDKEVKRLVGMRSKTELNNWINN